MALNSVTTFRTAKKNTLLDAMTDVETFLETLDETVRINIITYYLVDGGKYYQGAVQHGAGLPQNLWQKETFDGKGFSFADGPITIPTQSETDVFLITNPTSSGKLVRIRAFLPTLLTPEFEIRAIVRIYRNPTITANGTAISIFPLRPSQTNTSILTAFRSPTISSRGTLQNIYNVGADTKESRTIDLGFYIEEGKSFLVTFDVSVIGEPVGIYVEWIEV